MENGHCTNLVLLLFLLCPFVCSIFLRVTLECLKEVAIWDRSEWEMGGWVKDLKSLKLSKVYLYMCVAVNYHIIIIIIAELCKAFSSGLFGPQFW